MATTPKLWINWRKLFEVQTASPAAVKKQKARYEKYVRDYLSLIGRVSPNKLRASIDTINWKQVGKGNGPFSFTLEITLKKPSQSSRRTGAIKTIGSGTQDPPAPPKP